jgi:hypothetical protein
MSIADRPETVDRRGACFADEARTGSEQVAIELETAHQRAVHGEKGVHCASPRIVRWGCEPKI